MIKCCSVNPSNKNFSRRPRGRVVRALGLHAAAPGSYPVLTSGLDLFPVVPDSTLPRFVNSQLVASCQLGFLMMFLLSLNCFFHIVKSGVHFHYKQSIYILAFTFPAKTGFEPKPSSIALLDAILIFVLKARFWRSPCQKYDARAA